jgi:hypothetical protein
MRQILDEKPEYWPHGLSPNMFADTELIKDGETPAGFLGWQRTRETDGTHTGWYSVGVLPEHRQRGLAKKSLRGFIDARKGEVDRVRALVVDSNKPSKALADSLGIPHQSVPDGFDFTSKAASSRMTIMTTGIPKAAAFPWRDLIKSLTGAGVGYGVSEAENAAGLLHDPSVQGVNALSNATIGALFPLVSPKARIGLASGFVGKQLAAKGIDSYVGDTPARLEIAKQDLATAEANRLTADANKPTDFNRNAILAMLGLGAAGVGTYAYNSLRDKSKKPTMSTSSRTAPGDLNRRKSKVKIEVPYSALPEEFYRSIINADDLPGTKTTEMPKAASINDLIRKFKMA